MPSKIWVQILNRPARMRTALSNAGLAGLLFVLGTVVQAADRQEPALSAAEQAVVAHQIATLKSSADIARSRTSGATPKR